MAAYLNPIDQGRQIVLDKVIVFLGRHPNCDVVLTDSRKISRRHCCIVQVNDKLLVRDLGSMNGIRVNGKRVRNEALLHLGDELTVGDLSYVLEQGKPDSRAQGQDKNAESNGDSSDASPVSHRPSVDISQDFPMPLPEEEIPDIELDDLLPEAGMDIENNEPFENPGDDVIMIEDSGEFEDQGSEIGMVSD
jgi:pSer/pThr/pTyr-binding forkhead associated (FHA) protein